jgi:hypothetical protein
MSNNLNKKLLAEAFDALVSENDVKKAERLLKRHMDLAAKSSYALLEAADEDFEVSDMGDDFNNEITDEIGSDSEEKFTQAQNAVDELADKFPAEMTDEISAKFDDVRNVLDELKLAEDGEGEDLKEDGAVALEELRGEFEMAGELSDEVADLFDEISAAINGDEVSEDEDVADDEEFTSDEAENADDMIGEADEEGTEGAEPADAPVADTADGEEGSYEDVQRGEDEVIDDIKYTAEDLNALIDELEGIEGDEKEAVEESFTNIADPRKKMTSEEEGVKKNSSMNFGKLPGMKMDNKAGLAVDYTVSQGKAPSSKVKMSSYENKGVKSWHKQEKPANKAATSKSLLDK